MQKLVAFAACAGLIASAAYIVLSEFYLEKMEAIKKIALIGGTGKSGKYLVRELIKNALPSKLLLRHPEDFDLAHPFVEIVAGDVRDAGSVAALLKDCQAVISTLGQSKGEPSVFSQATRNVLQAMQAYGIKRYIVITGLSVNAPGDNKGSAAKAATEWMKTHYAETTNDKQVEYEILSASKLNWTLVRLPLIEQTEVRSAVRISLEDCPGKQISAANLAHFLVRLLSDESFNHTAPFIADV